MHSEISSEYIEIAGTKIHYLIAGQGAPILFIHGFPTSSYLWRNIMTSLSDKFQVIAIDLPGYGKSDKNIEDSFSFRYYNRILTGFLDHLNLDHITLGVHDLGGPIGLYWMVQNMERVHQLILFNTLVFPQFSWAVKLFALATVLPGIRDWLTSPKGIKKAIYFGVYRKDKITADVIQHYQSPFEDMKSRKVLLKSVQRLSLKGFSEIERKLPSFKGPVQIIYGENDKILPKVGATMKRVQGILSQANIISIPDCGHFLQEDAPDKISATITAFMGGQ
ncbi:MAG: alpha/beta fold hydrolase [Bacteroidia bacterium]|nr:alpha/beta fold hydrolase [Bacteroidia bacterium]